LIPPDEKNTIHFQQKQALSAARAPNRVVPANGHWHMSGCKKDKKANHKDISREQGGNTRMHDYDVLCCRYCR
jgi:hypothetical protein